VDLAVARAWAWDAETGRWLGRGAWWADSLLHRGGRAAILAVALVVGLALLASRLRPSLHAWSRPAGYLLLAMALGWGAVGGLKQITNIACPLDLEDFGGRRPYVSLLGERPANLPRAKCFPGAHAASGFALLAFYFGLRERRPRAARAALLAGLAVGTLFSFAQQARGAHFLSHDVWSAFLVWLICAALYIGPYRAALWPGGTRLP
jgi:membrane-associated PAP2 superfamily phosphatase